MPADSDVPDWGKKTSQSLDIDMPSGETTAKFYYTVTGMPSFWGDAGAKQYVWIFDGTDGDHWVKANFDSGTNTLTFSTVWNFTKLITVRMNPSHSDLPSWDAKWNKSKDLLLSGNTAVYQEETP